MFDTSGDQATLVGSIWVPHNDNTGVMIFNDLIDANPALWTDIYEYADPDAHAGDPDPTREDP